MCMFDFSPLRVTCSVSPSSHTLHQLSPELRGSQKRLFTSWRNVFFTSPHSHAHCPLQKGPQAKKVPKKRCRQFARARLPSLTALPSLTQLSKTDRCCFVDDLEAETRATAHRARAATGAGAANDPRIPAPARSSGISPEYL